MDTEDVKSERSKNRQNEVQTKRLDLDTILVNEIGQFGLYQIRSLLLALSIIVFNAWVANEYIFTTARIDTRCLIPECEIEDETTFSPAWISNAIPWNATDFDGCERYLGISNITIPDPTCPVELFDQDTTVGCEARVYENTHTIVHDFDLGCEEWLRSLVGTISTCGTLIALPASGYISDHWGRRTAMVISAFNAAWVGLTRQFANSYGVFVFLEFLELALGAAGFLSAYILVIELVGPTYRVMAGTILNTFFALGQVFLGLIAWGVPNWRNLTLALYIPQLITLLYIKIMAESVRWYMSKGRFEDSERVLKEVAKVNKRHLSEQSLAALRQSAEEGRLKELQERGIKKPWLPVLVFRNKTVLLRCMVTPLCWVATTFIYYGMSINSVSLTGNRFLNYIAVAAIEIPGFWTSFVLISFIGRKPVLIISFWICAICQIAYIFISNDLYVLSLAVYLIGKYSIAMVMTAIYVYTSELYPTEYRHSLVAFSSVVGRIGAILAPLTPALATVWEHMPSVIFGGLAAISGSLIIILPETLGSKLPDTMEEAAEIGRKKR